jgi:ABC-type bacteriocin/lantibiotic exporter with double-glycine peptidase domain
LAFNSALGIFSGAVSSISSTVTDILGIVPLWERAKPILQTKPEYEPHRVNPGQLQSGVVLERVTFRYRDEGLPVLDDINLCAGRVYYDGKDLASLDLVAVRRQLGVVLQSGRIGSGSIFDNITAGALVSHEKAWEAARMAGFAEDIEQMPMKMHTVISEGGTNLSGGQKQRLLIARALVNQPKIIVMDEATSSLDNRTQGIVVESLDKLKTTRIVIAHRLSTIRHADRIYVVEAGRVVQVGTFEELVQQEGLFAQLVARQME